MKIVRLAVENVKRVEAVDITPQGDVVVIGGQNGAGKTSVLDSIAYAIGGKRLCPAKPLREGAKKGSVDVDLGELRVVRTFTKSPKSGEVKSEIVVTEAAGGAVSSPQTLLDRLVGDLSFDPLEFVRMKAEDQVKVLRQVAGVDTDAVDKEIGRVYEERRTIGAALKTAEAGLEEIEHFADTPAGLVDVQALLKERDAALAHNRELSDSEALIQSKRKAIADGWAAVKRLERQIDADRARVNALTEETDRLAEEIKQREPRDTSAITQQIDSAQETNRRVQANQFYMKAAARVKTLGDEHDRTEAALAQLREKRVGIVQKAKMPIDGLDLGDGGVLYRGVPFEQASSAEQLRVSVAMGLALNPELKVLLIRDGSLLDDANLATIAAMAHEADAQVWIERVGEGEECSVVIEEGRVKGAEEAEAE